MPFLRMFVAASMVAMAVAVPAASKVLQARSTTCQKLCHAGLGGLPCGCDPKLVALNFSQRMEDWRINNPDERVIKGPRRHLCPLLCRMQLGEPLCECRKEDTSNLIEVELCPLCNMVMENRDVWAGIGCNSEEVEKKCNGTSVEVTGPKSELNTRKRSIAETQVDWNLWCHIQCEQGNGGIACNCDMLPLIQ